MSKNTVLKQAVMGRAPHVINVKKNSELTQEEEYTVFIRIASLDRMSRLLKKINTAFVTTNYTHGHYFSGTIVDFFELRNPDRLVKEFLYKQST